jgi:DHA1 family tetracycline resistance protein-like MFS transporter
LLSSAGSAVECLILALAPNLAWLFVGRVLTGATTAGMTASAAYIADVTPPEKRAGAFGLVGAAFGIGFAVGPAIGGVLGNIWIRLPFYVTAGLMIASTAYGLFILPESLTPEKRHAVFDWKRANPLGSLRLFRRHRELLGLVTSLFCSNLAVQSFSVFVLYTIYRFGWSERDNGFGLTVFGALSVIASILTGRLVKTFGPRTVVAAGFALGTAGFLIYGLAGSGIAFACALPLTGLWAIAGPPVQSAMSTRVSASEQGELQGAIGSMRSIALIVGPPFFAFTFAEVSAHGSYPLVGLPWFLGGALLIGAIVAALRVLRPDIDSAATEEPAAVALANEATPL